MPEPLTPTDARAILAWLDICESHRTFQCLRAGTDGGPEVAKFLADHPTGSASIAKLRALAADEGETVTERSCFTCAHRNNAVHSCVPFLTDRALGPVTIYVVESRAGDAPGGMPTNRSIPCPGHAPKVTT